MSNGEREPRRPSAAYRFTARSLPEVLERMEAAVSRVNARRSVLFRGRKLSVESFLNAILVRALAMPPEELEELLRAGVADYERILGEGTTLPEE